jgi:hypothetical protein
MSARRHSGEQGHTVSMVFLAFNQSPFLEQAARGILEQTKTKTIKGGTPKL